MRVFAEGWGDKAEAFQPAAVAGAWAQFEELLGREIPSLTHAVVVLARRTEELLNEGQRAALWRAFRVPVFEQILADDGSLLAMECEAYDGLHVESAMLAADVENGEVGSSSGLAARTTPRMRRLSRDRTLVAAV